MGSPIFSDMENMCRVCMKPEMELFFIFDEKNALDSTSLADILSECTMYKVQRYDQLPHQICVTCMDWAKNAFKFKRHCEQSYRKLIGMLNEERDYLKQIKQEIFANVEKSTQTEDSTMYPCERCEEKFFTFHALRAHRECEHKGSAIECRFCSKTFNRIGYLKSHIAISHPETGYMSHNQCNICKRQFTRREHMRRHLALIHKIVHTTNVNECDEEEEKDSLIKSDALESLEQLEIISNMSDKSEEQSLSDEITNLNENRFEEAAIEYNEVQSSEDDDEKPLADFITNSCNNFAEVLIEDQPSFNEMEEFEEQISTDVKIEMASDLRNELCGFTQNGEEKNGLTPQTTINDNEKLFTKEETMYNKCNEFNKNFQNQRGRSKNKKILTCTDCKLTFTHTTQYKRHIETTHSFLAHQCKICQKTFKTKLYMQRHMASHGKKRYTCKECSGNFLTKVELTAHIKEEGHDKPLLCPECGLRCKTSNILMVHMRRHKGEKPYKCKFCSKGFPRIDDLRIHEKYHTNEKSHFCETCGKGFQRKYNLTIHMRVHTGEKPYQCPHCPHAFTQSNDLKSHIRRHTGERFRCEICGAPFLQGYQMRQHKLAEHGVKENPPTQRVEKYTSPEEQEQQIKQNLQRELAKNGSSITNFSQHPMEEELDTISNNIVEPGDAIMTAEISFLNM